MNRSRGVSRPFETDGSQAAIPDAEALGYSHAVPFGTGLRKHAEASDERSFAKHVLPFPHRVIP